MQTSTAPRSQSDDRGSPRSSRSRSALALALLVLAGGFNCSLFTEELLPEETGSTGSGCSSDENGACCGDSPPPANAAPDNCDEIDSGVCIIIADQDQELKDTTFECPPGIACTILCEGDEACENSTFVCPETGHACTVSCDCNGVDCCEDTTIECGSSPCTLRCGDAEDACESTDLNCGDNACEATCAGSSSPTLQACEGSCRCSSC